MSLIITATDFSATGNNAVNYACALAAAYRSEVVIIHTFIMPVMFSEIPVPATLINDEQNDATAQMRVLTADLQAANPGLDIKGKIAYGDLADALEEYEQNNNNPWVVIIGNNSQDNNTAFDSTLLETLKNSKYPVLAVPSGTTYQPVKKMCFTYDNKYPGSDLALMQLRDLQQRLGAVLHVLYANPDVPNQDNHKGIDSNSQAILADADPKYHYSYGVSIENTISTFVTEEKPDWLVVMPRRHSFFESIFHKSHTKAMAHSINIPLLALHENN